MTPQTKRRPHAICSKVKREGVEGDEMSNTTPGGAPQESADLIGEWAAGLSRRTRVAYRGDLERFLVWAELSASDVPRQRAARLAAFLATWRDALAAQMAPSSVNRRLFAVQSFFRWLHVYGYAKSWAVVPTASRLKARAPASRTVGVDKVASVLRGLRRSPRAMAPRDYAMVRLFWDLGLRLAEVAGLRWEDVAQSPPAITVQGKGGSRVKLLLPPATHEGLEIWRAAKIKQRGEQLDPVAAGGGTSVVFTGSYNWNGLGLDQVAGSGEQLDQVAGGELRGRVFPIAHRTIQRRLTLMGLVGPLALRKGSATFAVETGLSLHLVRDHLRHRSIQTTMIYVETDKAENALKVASAVAQRADGDPK